MPRRDPFHTRRKNLLRALDKLMVLHDMGYDEFVNDWQVADAAAMNLLAIGELLGPGTPHAPDHLAETFYEMRNLLGHEYFHVAPDRLWRLMAKVPELRDEVEARDQAAASKSGTEQARA